MLPFLSLPSEWLNCTDNFDTTAAAERCKRGRTRTFTLVVSLRPPGGEGDEDEDQSLSAFQFARSKNGGSVAVGADDHFFLRDCNAIKGLLRFSSEPCAFLWRSIRIIYHSNMFFSRDRGGGGARPRGSAHLA